MTSHHFKYSDKEDTSAVGVILKFHVVKKKQKKHNILICKKLHSGRADWTNAVTSDFH